MPLPCSRCNTPLPNWELANGAATCTSCGSSSQVNVFPALLAPAASLSAEDPAAAGEASCFDHASRRAVAACQQCGRYVCRLCSVDFGGQTWCPSCVAAGAGRAASSKLETSRNLFDSTALILPLVSLLVYPLTLIAAPASLVLSVVKWSSPLSLVRRSRWRFGAAIVVSVGEIVGWTALIAYLISRRFRIPQ